jgi:hypothetical protein
MNVSLITFTREGRGPGERERSKGGGCGRCHRSDALNPNKPSTLPINPKIPTQQYVVWPVKKRGETAHHLSASMFDDREPFN